VKAKLLALLQQLKSAGLSLASKWPLPVGVALGYLLHPEIKLALDLVSGILKGILKLL
jgi:hypothetical protein